MKRNIIIVVSAILVLALIFVLLFTNLKQDEEACRINALPDKIAYLPYLKDGSIYYYRNGEKILVAKDCYDINDPVYSADYAIDTESGKMLCSVDGALYFFDGSSSVKIADKVKKWKTQKGMERVVYTVLGTDRESSDIGGMFIFENGQSTLADVGISVNSIYIADMYIYALKPNSYPLTRSSLVKYTFSGECETVDTSMPNILYANDETAVTTESTDGTVSTYYFVNGKSKLTLKNVYKSEISRNKKYMFVLADFDGNCGKFFRIDLLKNEKKFLKDGVNDFSCDAVVENDGAAVYSVMTDELNMSYSAYYSDFDKTDIRLLHNGKAELLKNIVIDGSKGYVLTNGLTQETNTLYEVEINKNNLKSRVIAKGAVGSVTYYGLTDSITFAVMNENGTYSVKASAKGEETVLTDKCSVSYGDGTYKAQCVLSNDGKALMYFSDFEENGDGACGTLCTTDKGEIDTDVVSGYYVSPVTDGSFSEIFYLKKDEDGVKLYRYFEGSTELIDTDVQALVSII